MPRSTCSVPRNASLENVIITGPTGVGKRFIACALAHRACMNGHSSLYRRLPRLMEDLHIARANGSYWKFSPASRRPTAG